MKNEKGPGHLVTRFKNGEKRMFTKKEQREICNAIAHVFKSTPGGSLGAKANDQYMIVKYKMVAKDDDEFITLSTNQLAIIDVALKHYRGEVPQKKTKPKIAYRVSYIGLAEGYSIEETTDDPDRYEVFRTWKVAHNSAIKKAESDVGLVKYALWKLKKLTEKDAQK